MGLVIYACHFAAVGFCGTLEERLASLSGKTYCSMMNPRKKMFLIGKVIEVMFVTVIF